MLPNAAPVVSATAAAAIIAIFRIDFVFILFLFRLAGLLFCLGGEAAGWFQSPGGSYFKITYRRQTVIGSPQFVERRSSIVMRSSSFRTRTPCRQERTPRKIRISTRISGDGSDSNLQANAGGEGF